MRPQRKEPRIARRQVASIGLAPWPVTSSPAFQQSTPIIDASLVAIIHRSTVPPNGKAHSKTCKHQLVPLEARDATCQEEVARRAAQPSPETAIDSQTAKSDELSGKSEEIRQRALVVRGDSNAKELRGRPR